MEGESERLQYEIRVMQRQKDGNREGCMWKKNREIDRKRERDKWGIKKQEKIYSKR